MSTIDELRSTLEQHAGDVVAHGPATRASAARTRARAVRRRKQAGAALGGALAVAAVVGGSVLAGQAGGSRTVEPAGPVAPAASGASGAEATEPTEAAPTTSEPLFLLGTAEGRALAEGHVNRPGEPQLAFTTTVDRDRRVHLALYCDATGPGWFVVRVAGGGDLTGPCRDTTGENRGFTYEVGLGEQARPGDDVRVEMVVLEREGSRSRLEDPALRIGVAVYR